MSTYQGEGGDAGGSRSGEAIVLSTRLFRGEPKGMTKLENLIKG